MPSPAMIDIHCHMLPGIDDGPRSIDESLEMARLAVANGISETIVTPHIHIGRYANTQESLAAATRDFQRCLLDNDIALRVRMAAEIRIGAELMAMVEAQQVPFLGILDDYQLVLLELPHSHIPPGSDKLVKWCLQRNIRPVIPHPERNKDVIRDIEKIAPLVKLGCLLQVTAGAVAGGFGPQARKRARELLKRGWVSFLASDAHNTQHRIPDLESGRAAAAAIIGEEESWRLVRDNPAAILHESAPYGAPGNESAR
ncbi:MAG: CpsB/CapC family capsule biosynthesis tyrosine phosphatase [Pseudomonadales bacterium]